MQKQNKQKKVKHRYKVTKCGQFVGKSGQKRDFKRNAFLKLI